MALNFRFAVASDLHIAVPHTISEKTHSFHLVEVSIPALELVLEHLSKLDIDFLLLPGDLTQDGEPENHTWLSQRLSALPYPVYVVPGNHDVPVKFANDYSIGLANFPSYYHHCGYDYQQRLYYSEQVLPGVRIIGLNSNQFDTSGKQKYTGGLESEQLDWLQQVLSIAEEELVIVMLHHNVIEHLPDQSHNSLGRRYMLENRSVLLDILQSAGVQLIFTGHLHVQDVAKDQGIYEITTGSLVSYPHPYRIIDFITNASGQKSLKIESYRINSLPNLPNLSDVSRSWIGDRSVYFMSKLLTSPPLNLSPELAAKLAPSLRYFWADIAYGDAVLDFPHFPPEVRRYFQSFNTTNSIDNNAILLLQ
ncbi:MAG: metallophosphoesterase [Trichodesmium sp. St16_bin4-tuft]|uniref:Metallophosphoesterase n=1 Tax=Trichodesmium erythraeum (strain IMS101) TaxID=203124 RepID=Q10Z32_TRIEI|nr:metallophosphoesterase [Trichodesmium erythraeum GBRTRLIN201]MCH2048125.1 metallophosphoesterase [Trichodesmium sp. ALOHA_ZT_67]MCL2927038.1 metallophosphoesterase [Trichodesmium sp. MAG_R01]MDE5067617.1 metallophosphoesterase [Trichodesmium sp. St4_bin8_1]MDE5072644.1 metallophosphoesterase [Trichodesmium sp. St5_bin8]MDE5079764.1 metallophosphoesterase [Trichodesmium sp. St2_bin6]MDE5090555.1 metallophosphoesterase [Trichodesmium sp. St18_bin3_1_1]MDE5099810.1 metallophosphoesterase [Tr